MNCTNSIQLHVRVCVGAIHIGNEMYGTASETNQKFECHSSNRTINSCFERQTLHRSDLINKNADWRMITKRIEMFSTMLLHTHGLLHIVIYMFSYTRYD